MNAQRLNDIYRNIRMAENSDIEDIKQLTVDYPFYHLPYVVLAKYYYDTRHYRFEDMLKQAAMRVKDRKELYHYIHGYGDIAESGVDKEELKYEPLQEETAVAEISPDAEQHILDTKAIDEAFTKAIIKERKFLYESYETENEIDASEDAAVRTQQVSSVDEQDNAGDQEILDEAFTRAIVQEREALYASYEMDEKSGDTAAKSNINEFLEGFGSEEEKPEEFVFEGRQEEVDLKNIEIDHDIIGEEIATEFSFSHAFQPDTETDSGQEPIKEETLADIQVEEPETKDSFTTEYPGTLSEHMRKNPVYHIEAAVRQSNDMVEEDLSPERDFFAWLKHPQYIQPGNQTVTETPDEQEEQPRDNKIDLIERFISINPQISRPKKEFFNPENMAKRSEVVDLEYVTETLANIYYEQGNADLAVKAYEKLSLQNPSKQAYFASLIEKIKKEKK